MNHRDGVFDTFFCFTRFRLGSTSPEGIREHGRGGADLQDE